ncbi:MAG TPA: hypothetical protein VHC69_08710 [Polyangiaceae bacterium]|nr:hypothetical protein [Polyangiaceae bacterium]
MHRSARLALLGATFGLAVSGCKTVAALKQRCLSGDVSACESACSKGVPGEGGCFHAGNLLRERAALDFQGADFRRASQYFGRSCDGGYADGCLLAGEMIAAPFTPDPSAESQKTISDADVVAREKRFDRACSRGSAAGCKRLGDALIGKNAERATAAYSKACGGTSAPADCRNARQGEVEQAEKWRLGCTRNVADDCTKLGDLLYMVDPPRAVRLFMAECALRGVAQLVGGVDRFVHDRIESARIATAESPPSALETDAAAHRFDVLSPTVDGSVAVTEVLRAFQGHAGQLAACLDLGDHHVPEELGLELIVDLTGDTFRTRISPPATPIEVARCLESVTDGFEFTPPQAITRISLKLRVHDAPPAAPAK